MLDKECLVISSEDQSYLVKFTEIAVNSRDLAELAQEVLPLLIRVLGGTAAVLCVDEHKPSTYSVCPLEVQRKTVQAIERICVDQFHQIPFQKKAQPWILSLATPEAAQVALYVLQNKEKRVGVLGLLVPQNRNLFALKIVKLHILLLSQYLSQFIERKEYEKEIAQLRAYFSVCSKIARALNLPDVIEAVLYSSMEAVSAEAASILLLDDEAMNFSFFGLVPPSRS